MSSDDKDKPLHERIKLARKATAKAYADVNLAPFRKELRRRKTKI